MNRVPLFSLIVLLTLISSSFIVPLALSDSSDRGRGREREGPRGGVEEDDEHGGRVVLTSGNLTAEFEGMKPRVKFYLNNETPPVEYQVKFKRLVEFDDSNEDGVFQSREMVAGAEIEKAQWNNTGFYSILDGTTGSVIGLGINFTTNTFRIVRQSSSSDVDVFVKFAVAIYNISVTRTLDNGTFTIRGGSEVKIDIFVGAPGASWPFGDEAHPRLALRVDLHSNLNEFEFEEEGRGRSKVRGNESESPEVGEHPLRMKEREREHEIEFVRVSNATTSIGFFQFVSRALADGRWVNVTASYKVEGAEDEGEKEFKLYLSYPRFNTTLEHDPSFGFASSTPPTSEETFITSPGKAKVSVAGVTVSLQTSISGVVSVTNLDRNPGGVLPAGLKVLGRYLNITTDIPSQNLGQLVTVRIRYNSSEAASRGLDETTLKVYRWTGASWAPLNSTLGSDSEGRYVEAVTGEFSYFAVMGRELPTPITATPLIVEVLAVVFIAGGVILALRLKGRGGVTPPQPSAAYWNRLAVR